jgi:hypothetical protein
MLLTPRTVGALVTALRRKDRQATIFAIESRTEWNGPTEIEVDGRKTLVREARTPLRLREVMHEPREATDLVILTNLDARSFGRENLAKAALRRIEAVQPWPVVRLVFGMASIDARLVQHAWMAERLLQASAADRAIAGGTLDFETAWSIILVGFGLQSTRPSDEEFLEAASKPMFAHAFQSLPPEGRDEFKRIMSDSLTRFGTTVLSVVERGWGDQLLAAGLVAQCLFSIHDSEVLTARGAFGERFGVRAIDGVIAARWGSAVRRILARPEAAGLASRVRAQADSILVHDLGGAALAHASDDLPSGLAQRVRAFADLVSVAMDGSVTEQSLAAIRDAVRRVEDHAMARSHGDAERAAMAARLVRWLATQRSVPRGLEDAVRRYADEECWVDRARVAIQEGESLPEVRRAYQALSRRVAEERAKLNEFVGPAAIEAALPTGALLGVEHVLEHVVTPLTKERPVAMIVMDGMSHSVALDLVRSLEEVAWARYRHKSHPLPPLVLSTIPTVTEFARTSLLCGRLRDGSQSEERAGFEAFLKAKGLENARTTLLFHKKELGADSSEVEQAIASDAKFVACVVNAIDKQLDGSDQLRAQWSLRTIPVLSRLVRACELAGRAIVLVSDHGHLVEEATEQLPVSGAETLQLGARWRSAGRDLRQGELKAHGPRVLAPGGSCIVAADERVRYCGRQAGYHGGVTVQELSCPLHVLIHTSSDSGLADWVPLEPVMPRWWSPDGTPLPTAVQSPPVARPRSRQKATGSEAGLFSFGAAAWIDSLFESEIYSNQRKNAGRAPLKDDVARRILEVFVGSGPAGACSFKVTEQALAARLGMSVTDTRRHVTLLRNLLNVDGYDVLGQPDRETVVLDVELLKTQFALTGGAA